MCVNRKYEYLTSRMLQPDLESIHKVRRLIVEECNLGIDEDKLFRFVTAVVEGATNAVKHGLQGDPYWISVGVNQTGLIANISNRSDKPVNIEDCYRNESACVALCNVSNCETGIHELTESEAYKKTGGSYGVLMIKRLSDTCQWQHSDDGVMTLTIIVYR